MFHNVLARKSFPLCNRARLNFQAFALRDMKMAAQEACRVGQKMTYIILNIASTRRSVYFNVSDL